MLRTFKSRITSYIIILVVCIAIIMAALSYGFIYNNIISLSLQYNEQLVSQVRENLELFLSDVKRETVSISYSPELRSYGNHFITKDLSPSPDNIKKIFWTSAILKSNIDDISLLSNDKKILSLFNMYKEDELIEISRYYSKKEILLQARFVPIIHKNNNGKMAISCCKTINNTSSNSNDIFLVTSIMIDEFFSILNQIDLGEGSGSCLVDAKSSIQYSSLTNEAFNQDMNKLIQIQDFSKTNSFITRLGGTKYIISVNSLKDSNLSIVVYSPLENVTESARPLLFTMLSAVILLLIVVISINLRFSNYLTSPITKLANYIHYVEEDLTGIPQVKGTIETDILYHSFNELLARINSLLQKNAEESKLLRKAELHALQSQINPHFLYNTLDSINAMAILKDDKEISNMTTSLAHLLRLSISVPGEFVTIAEEIKHVKAYLTIQQIRYDDKFSADFDIDENMLSFPIVRLILQPLVENSIYHGMELKNGKGHILIRVKEIEDILIIQIIDDGNGVDEQTATEINENLSLMKKPGEGRSVGIYNVNERIRLYYGDSASLQFESKLGEGTKITITILK